MNIFPIVIGQPHRNLLYPPLKNDSTKYGHAPFLVTVQMFCELAALGGGGSMGGGRTQDWGEARAHPKVFKLTAMLICVSPFAGFYIGSTRTDLYESRAIVRRSVITA